MLKRINSRILQSEIWDKPYYVRITFLTLLLMRDEKGFINCKFEYLKRVSNIAENELKNALSTLKAINIYNENVEFSGPLVKEVPNGYKILDLYNDYASGVDRKEKNKIYMRQYRAAKKELKNGLKVPEREEKKEYKQLKPKKEITNPGLKFK